MGFDTSPDVKAVQEALEEAKQKEVGRVEAGKQYIREKEEKLAEAMIAGTAQGKMSEMREFSDYPYLVGALRDAGFTPEDLPRIKLQLKLIDIDPHIGQVSGPEQRDKMLIEREITGKNGKTHKIEIEFLGNKNRDKKGNFPDKPNVFGIEKALMDGESVDEKLAIKIIEKYYKIGQAMSSGHSMYKEELSEEMKQAQAVADLEL